MKCMICGWDLANPYKGCTMTSGEVAIGQVDGKEFALHLVCLLRDGVALGDRMSTLLGLRNQDEGTLTRAGAAIIAKGRVA